MGARSNPAKKPSRTQAVVVTEYADATHVTLVRWRAMLTLYRERPNLPDERYRKKVLYAILGIQTLQPRPWCRGAMEVTNAAAQSGYGPMLYDASLTVARGMGAPGLIPDRSSVSPAARKLWEHYKTRRPDVDAQRLGLFCRRHRYLGVDVLDHVYSLNREIAGVEGLLERGGAAYAQLVEIAGSQDEALAFIAEIRLVFWQCYFHGMCPVDVKPSSRREASAAPNPAKRRARAALRQATRI